MDGHRVHLGALQEVNLGVIPGRHRKIGAWLRGPRRLEQRLSVEVEVGPVLALVGMGHWQRVVAMATASVQVPQQGPVKVAGHDGDAVKVGVHAIRSKYTGRGQPLQAMVEVEEAPSPPDSVDHRATSRSDRRRSPSPFRRFSSPLRPASQNVDRHAEN